VTLVSLAYYHVWMPVAPAPTVDIAELASQLRMGVTRLARKLRREADPAVTPTQLAALTTVERHGPMTAGSLAAHEQIQKPTATRLIAGLTDAGLVDRLPDPTDGRVVWISITSEGKRFLQRFRRRSNEYLAKRIKGLDPEELAILGHAAAILERLTESGS
jgi:DNA-binding MarR family transcriptional regulator